VRSEPLRESAHRAVIAVHLAEDNVVEAVRQYQRFRRLLYTELNVEPSHRLTGMLAPWVPTAPAPLAAPSADQVLDPGAEATAGPWVRPRHRAPTKPRRTRRSAS
jgi:hypothetical protein